MKDLKPFDFDTIGAKEAIEMLSRPWQHFFSAKLFVSHLGVLNVQDEVELQDKKEAKMNGPDRDTQLNNAGQEDGAKPYGSYDPPHSVTETIIGDTAKCEHENAVYTAAFHTAREQSE